MEDYLGVAEIRCADVDVLIGTSVPRCLATAHIGGIAVECKLKSLISAYHRIVDWGDRGNRLKDPRKGSPIENPGHGLMQAIRLMPALYEKAKLDQKMLEHLNVVLHPKGSMSIDYIALRYSTSTFSGQAIKDWKKSFDYVLRWIDRNRAVIYE